MTPESIKMSELIMDADRQCENRGHSMNWQRYNHHKADATCMTCKAYVLVKTYGSFKFSNGTAVTTNCNGKDHD